MEYDQPSRSSASINDHEEVGSTETLERIKEMVSSLPTEKGWRSIQPLGLHQGFWCYLCLAENIKLSQEQFKAKPADIIVCSLPKCGTTWLKALTFSIVTRTRLDSSTNPLLFEVSHNCMPAFHGSFTKKVGIREKGLPLIASLTPYASLSKSIHDSDCKIVYICREPKDAFVCMFHFMAKLRPKEYEPISLEEVFELYCEGKSPGGPFWEHILGYWKASLKRPEKILFLKYENLMADTTLYVKKLAEFMGYPFSSKEEQEGVVHKIVETYSFEFLNNLEINNKTAFSGIRGLSLQNHIFYGKGKVGDWKNHLTIEMVKRMDKITEEILGSFGLTFGSPS